MSVLDILGILLTAAGAIFFSAGTLGILRFPDLFCRLHALTKTDNLGLGLVAVGVAAWEASWSHAVKIALIWLIALFASAVVAHLIAHKAYEDGVEPLRGDDEA